MTFDIILDIFVGDGPGAIAEITLSPDLLAPELLSKIFEGRHQNMGGLALELLDKVVHADLGGQRDEKAYMVL
jgi:hypothetical protein